MLLGRIGNPLFDLSARFNIAPFQAGNIPLLGAPGAGLQLQGLSPMPSRLQGLSPMPLPQAQQNGVHADSPPAVIAQPYVDRGPSLSASPVRGYLPSPRGAYNATPSASPSPFPGGSPSPSPGPGGGGGGGGPGGGGGGGGPPPGPPPGPGGGGGAAAAFQHFTWELYQNAQNRVDADDKRDALCDAAAKILAYCRWQSQQDRDPVDVIYRGSRALVRDDLMGQQEYDDIIGAGQGAFDKRPSFVPAYVNPLIANYVNPNIPRARNKFRRYVNDADPDN